MARNALNLHRRHVCYVHTTLRALLLLLCVGALLLLPVPLHAASTKQTTPPKVIHPSARPPLTFEAELQTDDAIVRWQVPEAESIWSYEIYRSNDCSWESAVPLDAPIFASVNSTTTVVSYSVIDVHVMDGTVSNICNYWLLGADREGDVQVFDAATLQGVQRLFLPVIMASVNRPLMG